MSLILRIIGSIAFALLVGVGILVASSHLLPLLSVGVLVALGALGVRLESRRPASGFGPGSVQYVVAIAAVFVSIAYAAIGAATMLGGEVLALSGACALAYFGNRWRRLGSPLDARRVSGRGRGSEQGGGVWSGCAYGPTGGSPAAAGRAASPSLLPTDPAALSIEELCRAWRVSYLELQTAHAPEALEHAVQLRRRYLDELCRRDPEGFRRWLNDGARAASDPSHHVRQRSGRQNGENPPA